MSSCLLQVIGSPSPQIKVKVAYNGDILVTYIDQFMNFDSLAREMIDICRFQDSSKPFTMKWIDDEGDPCMLTTQRELDEALRLYELNNESDMTILVLPGFPEEPGSLCPGEDKNMYRKGAKRWRKLYRINGHLFQLKRFSRKAVCVLCNDRIWGLGRQGLKCINCKLLIHKKCHNNVGSITCTDANQHVTSLSSASANHVTTKTSSTSTIASITHRHEASKLGGGFSYGTHNNDNNNNDIIIENESADFSFVCGGDDGQQLPEENSREADNKYYGDARSEIIDSYEYMRALRQTPSSISSKSRIPDTTAGSAYDKDFLTDTVPSKPSITPSVQLPPDKTTKVITTTTRKALKDISQAFPIITTSSTHSSVKKHQGFKQHGFTPPSSQSPHPPILPPPNQNGLKSIDSALKHAPTSANKFIPAPYGPVAQQLEPQQLNSTPRKKLSSASVAANFGQFDYGEKTGITTIPILGRPSSSNAIHTPSSRARPKSRYQLSDFELIKVIGRGSYAKVFLTELRETRKIYAMKVIKKELINDEEDVDWVQTEKHVFETATHHPFLVGLHSCFQTPSRLIFVIEFVNGGDLMFHMQRQRRLPEDHARFYSAEIILALNFLHRKGIVYRDLKLDNVLLDSEGHIRLTDYGMCKEGLGIHDKTSTFCGTPNYIAPEILRGDDYGFSVDWWALGVLMFEMLAGRSPFDIVGATDNPDHNTEDYLFQVILEKTIRIPRSISVKSASVLKGFLNKEPKERLGCHPENGFQDIVNHCFFKSIDWEMLESKQLTPPFKPKLTNERAVDNFDPQFTNEPAILTPDEPSVLERLHQTEFDGFEYVNPLMMN